MTQVKTSPDRNNSVDDHNPTAQTVITATAAFEETDEKPEITLYEQIQTDLKSSDILLAKQFNFYNSHITTNVEDKVGILKDHVVNYYQGRQI